jgi:tRNA (guanine37-N1)-methyltransferase
MKKPRVLRITIITLFPKFTDFYTSFGIIARAIKKKLLAWRSLDLRAYGLGARKTVDDRPYGGGVGMVLRPDILYAAIIKAQGSRLKPGASRVILLTPSGKRFTQKDAQRLAKYDELIFVSGRYEGYDERIVQFVDEQISIGDYVLMGGELPALVIAEAVLRNVPGVLGKDESARGESFSGSMLEFPQYTKPEVWEVKVKDKSRGVTTKKKLRVPAVLLTGHHENIDRWRSEESSKKTKKVRPDLLSGQGVST